MAGLFITFEGPDGAGKTTQMRLLAERLGAKGYKLLCTREPGGTRISDQIRHMLLDPANKEMTCRTEALLYAASRAQHVAEVILPALESGSIVLCDRFVDSSLAYQGWGRGLDKSVLIDINQFAAQGIAPNITILLDICSETSDTRMTARHGTNRDRMEQEETSFRDRIGQGFRDLAGLYSNRITKIDGGRSVQEVHAEIWDYVIAYLRSSKGVNGV